MIFDNIEFLPRYTHIHDGFTRALEYLTTTDLSRLEVGRHEIAADNVYCLINEYHTKPKSIGQFEAHRKYIDIQYIISGWEKIGYAPLGQQRLIKEYDPEHDYALYSGRPSFVNLAPAMFAIFFPNDLHMPGIGRGNIAVKKAVIKVKV